MTKRNALDPDTHVMSPYDGMRMPPPSSQDEARLGMPGLNPKSQDKAVQISTKVQPAIIYAMDRILERRVYNLSNRQDFYRLALANLIAVLEQEIQESHVRTLVHRLERQRALYGELSLMRDVTQMIEYTQKAVDLLLSYDNRLEAIRALRNIKRYVEDLPYEGLRARVVNAMYGSAGGREKPEGWDTQEAAMLWHKVWEGELDKDDEDLIEEQMRVFALKKEEKR